MENIESTVNFIFEVGILSQLPRSGAHYLYGARQSIAEHVNRTVYIGLLLAASEKDVDVDKVVKMCLLHDLDETRTGDLNHIAQQYLEIREKESLQDTLKNTPIEKMALELMDEYQERKTKEAIIAKDADILELLFTCKELVDTGKTVALSWIEVNEKRLKTSLAKEIAEQMKETPYDAWWLHDGHKNWVSKNK